MTGRFGIRYRDAEYHGPEKQYPPRRHSDGESQNGTNRLTTANELLTGGPQALDGNSVICHCFNLTRQDVRAHMKTPGATLDTLVAQTRVGTKCTACLLDLDVLLADFDQAGSGRSIGSFDQATGPGRGAPWERVDSGFFLNQDGIQTILRIANFDLGFAPTEHAAAHDCRLWVFNDAGKIRARDVFHVGGGEETTINLSDYPACPGRGWFLIAMKPRRAGYYGTMRPQVALVGRDWVACYHTQFHADAVRSGRRSGIVLRTKGPYTGAAVYAINGSNAASGLELVISDHYGYRRNADFQLAARGSAMIEIDRAFRDLPSDASLLLDVHSQEPTRKCIINRHGDGSLGVDHFPNFP